jgi:hypothetical protein
MDHTGNNTNVQTSADYMRVINNGGYVCELCKQFVVSGMLHYRVQQQVYPTVPLKRTDEQILEELRAIRKLLEAKS